MNQLLRSLLLSLPLTLLLELPPALLLGTRSRKTLTVFVLANILTNPAAVLLCAGLAPLFGPVPLWLIQLPVELAVFFSEALVYRAFREDGFRRPWLLSGLCNGISWGAGLVIAALRLS